MALKLQLIWITILCHNVFGTELSMSDKIKHIVVLMLENRSFDNMLGFMSVDREDINGCHPDAGIQCSNPLDPDDPDSERVYVSNDGPFVQPADPPHWVNDTTEQCYGTMRHGNNVNIFPAPMNGFIKSYSKVHSNGSFIMKCLDQHTLPILHSLANEFGVIDAWFSEIPGPTTPNRLMAMRGHTNGTADMKFGTGDFLKDIIGYPGFNIFQMIDEYSTNESYHWEVFSGDVPNVVFLDYPRNYRERFHTIDDFYLRTMDGTLPFLSWLEPSFFELNCLHRATDQHGASHDTNIGEKLIKDVYESLRVSAHWNDTFLLIYYDEHGGFFDHVSPPEAPNPDGHDSVDVKGAQFDFTRLGVRVPAVLVSPYIKKGTTNRVTPPNGESQYAHTSLIHTIRNEYCPTSPALSAREDWSLTFEDLINLDEPRTDCPVMLPPLARCSSEHNCWSHPISGSKLSELQEYLAKLACVLVNKLEDVVSNEGDEREIGQIAFECWKEWKANASECLVEKGSSLVYVFTIGLGVGCFVVGVLCAFCCVCIKKQCDKKHNHHSVVSDPSDASEDEQSN